MGHRLAPYDQSASAHDPVTTAIPSCPLPLARAVLAGLGGALLGVVIPGAASAQALFQAGELEQSRFVLVAAPIGKGERSQLNIYEQIRPTRPCFAVGEGRPAAVDPLLATFDFTGICGRYIDANGYSLRVGGSDLATSYRLMVSRSGNDTLLLAIPTRGSGPEMVVARTGGNASGFMKLHFEPGWSLKRRQFGGRALGHVYVYSDSFPGATAPAGAPAPAPAGASSANPNAAVGVSPASPARPAGPAGVALPPLPATAPAAAPATAPGAKGGPAPSSTRRAPMR
jgi:hypothetical protein